MWHSPLCLSLCVAKTPMSPLAVFDYGDTKRDSNVTPRRTPKPTNPRTRKAVPYICGAVAVGGHNSTAATFGRRLPVMRLISIVKTSTEWPGILGGRPRAP